MSNSTISTLPSGAPAQSTDTLPVARSGTNVKLAVSDITALTVAKSPATDQTITAHSVVPAAANTTQSLGLATAPWQAFLRDVTLSKLNNLRFVDGTRFSTLKAAIDDLPSTGGIVISTITETISTDPFSAAIGVTGKNVIVLLGNGQWTTNVQIVLPAGCRIVGSGRPCNTGAVGTEIIAGGSFPTSTPMFCLGATAGSSGLVFGTRLENLSINTNFVAGVGAVYSNAANEQSGLKNVLARHVVDTAYDVVIEGGNSANHWKIEDCEFGTMRLSNCGVGKVARVTLNAQNNTSTPSNAVLYIDGSSSNTWIRGYDIHVEASTNGLSNAVFIKGANANVHIFGLDASTSVKDVVNIDATATGDITVLGVSATGISGNFITNSLLSENVANLVSGYIQVAGQGSFTFARTLTIRNLNSPLITLKSSNNAGSSSRCFLDMLDGNGNGWRVRSQSDGTNVPIDFSPYSASAVGNVMLSLLSNGQLQAKRVSSHLGSSLVVGDLSASANWGTSPVIAVVGGNDQAGSITIQAKATVGANPTLTLTFHDGTWTTIPVVVVSRTDTVATAGAPSASVSNQWHVTSVSATQVVFTFLGTPVANSTYGLNFICMGT